MSRRRFLETTTAAAGGCLLCGLARPVGATPGPESSGVGGSAEHGRPPVSDALLGYCGLYCGGCQAYQETTTGKKPADEDSTRCLGCASEVVASWCQECAIKDCARQKGLRTCRPCEEYPCEKLKAFTDDPRYPYHKAVHADMARLEEIGLEAWLAEQSERWVCPSCGNPYHWFARTCPTCGTRVNEQYWPD